jgi:hypothetical protein
VVGVSDYQANGSPLRRLLEDTAAECRSRGEIAELIQGSDWCWTCVYTDPPSIDSTGRPALSSTYPGGMSHDR